jgi:outer membrane protein assembly factor BamB
VTVGRGLAAWARRGVVAAVLIAAAVIPGRASSQANPHCTGARCAAEGSVLWTSRLRGSWLAEDGVAGTVPREGDAYAASAGDLAVLAYGTTVTGYQARTGQVRWQADLSGFAASPSIVSVRAWPAAVAVGVSVPTSQGGEDREEIILSAATGSQLRSYPAADYGGAAQASVYSTVIVGPRSVTSYVNKSGRVIWRHATGTAAQAWIVSGQDLYVTMTSNGYLSSSPVTALSQIDLRTGARRVIRPPGHAFAGTMAAVADGVLLFTGNGGLSAYSTQTGRRLWRRASAVLELVDQSHESIYIATGNNLTALNITTGEALGLPAAAVSASLYAVKDGVALGLDDNALGEAWGYSMSARKAVWTSSSLPWPHFFVDLTGLGGSISQGSAVTLVTMCAGAGAAISGSLSAPCSRPELAAIRY